MAPAVRFARRHALTLALGAAVFGLALDGGTYALTSRNPVAIGIWWALILAVALSVWPLARPTRAALLTGGLLFAFALLTGLSIAWAESAEKAFAELDRVLLYFGAFILAVAAGTPGNASRWRDGIAIGLAAVGLLALSGRLFGDLDLVGNRDLFHFPPDLKDNLNYPVGYRNGVAILVALGFPLLLSAATERGRSLLGGLALVPAPALVAVIYLTSSRGGAATAAVGTILFVALTGRRAAALGAVLSVAAASVVVIAVLEARPQLVDGPLDSATAASQGESAALLIALACLAAGVLYGLGSRFAPSATFQLGPWPKRGLAVAGVLAVIGGLAATGPRERFEQFKEPPDLQPVGGKGYTEPPLLSGGGTGRWQFWESAFDEFETRPVLGRGAGSYEAWWAQHGSLPLFIRDAHSLYVETLAELGAVGLCLLLAVFGSAVVAAIRRIRARSDERRSLTAALAATFAAFAVGAGVDWMWELTVVGIVGIACLGLLVGPATATDKRPMPHNHPVAVRARRSVGLRAAFVLAASLFIVLQAIPLLAQTKIQESQEAVARGDGTDALEHALAARTLQGWATSPHLQLALVEEQTGDFAAARASIATAIDRDRLDWRLWLVSARLDTKAGRIEAAHESLKEAKRLNPRSPIFASP